VSSLRQANGKKWSRPRNTRRPRVDSTGVREGELKGKRDALLRLLARAGIALSEDQSARIWTCTDPALLDLWVDNVLGAKTATDVLS
jgi:hypothetical protein